MKTTIVPQGDGIYMAVPAAVAGSPPAENSRRSVAAEPELNEYLINSKKLIGSTVRDLNQEDLGIVTDVVFETMWQRVAGFLFKAKKPFNGDSDAFVPAAQVREIDSRGNLLCELAQDAANGNGALISDKGHRVSDLHSMEIVNERGEALGRLLDVMIDVRNARPAIAILSYGGCGRILAGMAAVPWSALRMNLDQGVIFLNAEAEELCQASIEDYDEVRRAQVRRRIYRQFGQKDPAYWESRHGRSEPVGAFSV